MCSSLSPTGPAGVEQASESVVKELLHIIAKDDDQQLVYGVVLEPDTEDAQGDVISAEEIEKTAHDYLVKSRVVGDSHQWVAPTEVVESFIAPVDYTVGKDTIKKGSWVLVGHVLDPDLWKKIKQGDYTGWSIGGYGQRKEV